MIEYEQKFTKDYDPVECDCCGFEAPTSHFDHCDKELCKVYANTHLPSWEANLHLEPSNKDLARMIAQTVNLILEKLREIDARLAKLEGESDEEGPH